MNDFAWTERKISDLVNGEHWEDLGDGVLRAIECRGLTYYEQVCKAEDLGDPEMKLDAIQLDMSIDRMTDMPAKAAIQLRMMGWHDTSIGPVIRDRRRRTGGQLVESAVKALARDERRRAAR